MTTPADELRAAAQMLRARATAAATEPRTGHDTSDWEFQPKRDPATSTLPPRGTLAAAGGGLLHGGGASAGAPRARGPWVYAAHGQYIALMDPGVGLGLADVFEAWARMGDLDPDLLNRVGGAETLAVARQINTEDPS